MCYIAIIKKINDKETNFNTLCSLEKELHSKMRANSDGYFVNGEKTMEVKKALDLVSNGLGEDMILHARLSTGGDVGLRNVHGWTIGNYTLVHNGAIMSYANFDRTNKRDCDTLAYFKVLVKALGKLKKPTDILDRIEKTLQGAGFWGRFALYNSRLDTLFVVGDFEAYLIDNLFILSSAVLKSVDTEILGVEFEASHSEIDGLGYFTGWTTSNPLYVNYKSRLTGVRFSYTPTVKTTTPALTTSHGGYLNSENRAQPSASDVKAWQNSEVKDVEETDKDETAVVDSMLENGFTSAQGATVEEIMVKQDMLDEINEQIYMLEFDRAKIEREIEEMGVPVNEEDDWWSDFDVKEQNEREIDCEIDTARRVKNYMGFREY